MRVSVPPTNANLPVLKFEVTIYSDASVFIFFLNASAF